MNSVSLRNVDLLARLRLLTGARVVAAPDEIWELIDLCGLRDVLAADLVRSPQLGGNARGDGQMPSTEEVSS
jgi:hypothetical protein